MSIPLFRMGVSPREIAAATAVLERGSHWADGPEIADFENSLAEFTGRRHCVVVNSGTSALFLGLTAKGIGPGDDVLIPSFTFAATANTVALTGAKPVFVDVGDNLCMDAADAASAWTPHTAAVIPVHYAGAMAAMGPLQELCEDKSAWLFEDAAQAMGASSEGHASGSSGDAAAFSFCQNKIITSGGEGGAFLTDDSTLAERVQRLRSHGRAVGDYFSSQRDLETIEPGHNMRMTSLQAAIGSVQLDRIHEFVEARRNLAARYQEQLDGVAGVTLHAEAPGSIHVRQLMTLVFDDPKERSQAMQRLQQQNIGCKVYHDPLHSTGVYPSNRALPNTERFAQRVLSVPIFTDMSHAQVDAVCSAIQEAA